MSQECYDFARPRRIHLRMQVEVLKRACQYKMFTQQSARTIVILPVLLFRSNARLESFSLCFFSLSMPGKGDEGYKMSGRGLASPTPTSTQLFSPLAWESLNTLALTACVVSSSSSPSPSRSWFLGGNNLLASSSSSAGVEVPSVSPPSGVVAAELLRAGGAPKLNAGVGGADEAASPVVESFGGVPKPNPSGLPMLPLG